MRIATQDVVLSDAFANTEVEPHTRVDRTRFTTWSDAVPFPALGSSRQVSY